MPCTYIETPQEIADREREARNRTIKPYKKEIDKVTRLLCGVLTELSREFEPTRQSDYASRLDEIAKNVFGNNELREWWIDHQHRDLMAKKKKKA